MLRVAEPSDNDLVGLAPVGYAPVLGLLVATMVAFGVGLMGMPFLIRLLVAKGVGQPIQRT